MAEPRELSRQEQILAEAQKKLERIERMRQQMIREVEREMQLLDKLRSQHEEFVQNGGTMPSLSNASPASFESQFDQFNAKSNERLKAIESTSINNGSSNTEKLQPIKNDKPFYSTGDRDRHWSSLMDDPGEPVYVSGRYVTSDHGNHVINSLKEYEYELSLRALPVSVGDVIRAPVHPTGHRDGKAFTTSHLQMQVTDIFTKPKFHDYHDRIDG